MARNLSSAAAALGRKGGSARSDAKTAASRTNGAKGGRPRTRRWYLHVLDGVAVARNGWPRYLHGRPVVITRDPGDSMAPGIELPGRTREEAWAAAQSVSI